MVNGNGWPGLLALFILLALPGCGGIAIVDGASAAGGAGGADVGTGGTDAGTTSGGSGGFGGAVIPPPNGCGPSSGVDLSGAWAGPWQTDSGLSGTWEVDWNQVDGTLDGSATVTGTECGSSAGVTGELDDACDVTFGLVDFSFCDVKFKGTVHESGDEMSGTFVVVAGTTASGTWTGSRQ